jgi:hypothetical protein
MLRRSISSTVASATYQARARSRISGQRITLLFAEFLGVVQTRNRPRRIEDHGRRDHRPGQRSAPGLIDAADETWRNDQFRHSMTARAAFSAVFWRS